MATTLAECEVLKQSRGEGQRGRRAFRGVRVFAIPKADVESLRSEFEPSNGNHWPGDAATWLATTDYVVDDNVIGDGTPNSFQYKCILNNGPAGVGAKEPPDSTYWVRVKSSKVIVEHRVEKEFPGRPGSSRVTSWYERQRRRRILRDNLGKGLIEVTVGHQMVRQRREYVGDNDPSTWLVGTDYVVGNVVRGDEDPDSFDYICILANGPSGVGAKQPPDATYWKQTNRVVEGPVDPEEWSATRNYVAGQLTKGDGDPDRLPYICILANGPDGVGAFQPPNATYWKIYTGKYQVVEGSNMWPKANGTIKIVSSATNTTLLAALNAEEALLGKYNDATLTNIGGFLKNTLLYVGYHTVQVSEEDDLSDETRIFWYDKNGWDNTATVQRFRKLVVQTQVQNEAGVAVAGQFARVTGWYPDEAEETRDVSLGPASFTAFNSMVDWDS